MADSEEAGSPGPEPWLTATGCRGLVALLLAVKLAVTAWNCFAFDGESYDSHHHARRAANGGFVLDDRSYDAPTYYLPALAYAAARKDAWRQQAREARSRPPVVQRNGKKRVVPQRSPFLGFLRATNFLYVGAFYLIWIYAVLPRVIPDVTSRTLAALLLLSLPGYQKLAAMPHPDNLHLLFATLCTAAWLRMPRVSATPRAHDSSAGPLSRNVVMAVTAGIAGLSRPFAGAIVAVSALANAAHVLLMRKDGWPAAMGRAVVVTVLTAALAGSWLGWRGATTGQWLGTNPKGYVEQFDRDKFDWFGHLTSFHLLALLETPNRYIARRDREHPPAGSYNPNNRYANSLATTLYSETWGDHWLYFSGPLGFDYKVLAKRVVLLLALPLLPLLLARMLKGSLDVLRSARRHGLELLYDPRAFLLLHLVVGVSMFLAWHLGSGLTPGKHSSIKFIYLAAFYAPAITLCFSAPLRARRASAWLAYLLLVYMAALPVAVFVPKGW